MTWGLEGLPVVAIPGIPKRGGPWWETAGRMGWLDPNRLPAKQLVNSLDGHCSSVPGWRAHLFNDRKAREASGYELSGGGRTGYRVASIHGYPFQQFSLPYRALNEY